MHSDSCQKKLLRSLFSVLSLLLFVACGGGGDASNDAQNSLVYNGSTQKMLIDASNAAEVTTGAIDDGIRGNAFTGFAALAEPIGSGDLRPFSILHLADIMAEAVSFLHEPSLSANRSAMAVQTSQESIEGSCGGTAAGRFSADDATGEFWGDLLFSDFCESNVTLNGKTSFAGKIDLATNELESMSFDFGYLTGRDLFSSFIVDGTLFLDRKDVGTAITMNLFFKDLQSEDVFWLNDYHLEIVDGLTTMTIDISGKYFHPQFGYVVLSTQQDLIIDFQTMVPVAGVLLAMGKNGTAGGPTMARLTCFADGRFQAEADTDGDGFYDWNSGMLDWDTE